MEFVSLPLFSGMLAGGLHVLSGPDHLAAVAPLSLDSRHRAYRTGLSWGTGHSLGVGVVALISLYFRRFIPPELLSSHSERLVGVLLIAIGLWGIRRAFKISIHAHEHEHSGSRHVHLHLHTGHHHASPGEHVHFHGAVGMGVLHGLAGGAHFLGVLPALALPTAIQAAQYLLGFGAGTLVAMGGFSWGIGRLARTLEFQGFRRLGAGLGLLAVGVGCFWILG